MEQIHSSKVEEISGKVIPIIGNQKIALSSGTLYDNPPAPFDTHDEHALENSISHSDIPDSPKNPHSSPQTPPPMYFWLKYLIESLTTHPALRMRMY